MTITDIPGTIKQRLSCCPFCETMGKVTPINPETLQATCTACGSVGGVKRDSDGAPYMYWGLKI